MAQISRPFQIAFVGVLALAAVWLFALHGRSASPSESSSAPVTPASTAASTPSSQGKGTGGTTSVYHGSAPGVAGLSNAISKAQGAVGTSQQSAKALEEKSAAASSAAASPGATATPQSGSAAAPSVTKATKVTSGTSTATVVTKAPAVTAAPAHKTTGPTHVAIVGAPANQLMVEADLKAGKVAVLLFWDPRGADDRMVQRQLWLLEGVHRRVGSLMHQPEAQRLLKTFGSELGKKIAVHRALAKQVASFGSITRGVQVYGTPSILVIGKAGQTTTITGLTEAFGIEQAIDEARP
jgi:hypothetical protein